MSQSQPEYADTVGATVVSIPIDRHYERVNELLASNNEYLQAKRDALYEVASANVEIALLGEYVDELEFELEHSRLPWYARAFSRIFGLAP